jgi:hypothetical protein
MQKLIREIARSAAEAVAADFYNKYDADSPHPHAIDAGYELGQYIHEQFKILEYDCDIMAFDMLESMAEHDQALRNALDA